MEPLVSTEWLAANLGQPDLVVFDADRVTDQATYTHSTRPSTGIAHVLVDGAFVVRDGDLVPDAFPGRALRAQPV